ncbi:polymer-forming cytoskeletal protein [Patescibacteria group bacterium]
MFKGVEGQESNNTIIGSDVMLTGNLKSESNIQINGKVKGKIQTKSDVVIGEGALVEGGIKSNNTKVTGTVQGNIDTKEDLEVSPSGRVLGDIITQNLIIQKGGAIAGQIKMDQVQTADDKSNKSDEEEIIEEVEPTVEEK